MAVVTWADGTHVKVDPEQAYRELRGLDTDGRIDPDEVVRIARSSRSVLHDEFVWDDAEAAGLWRRDRACLLVRSLRVDGVPVFVRVTVAQSPSEVPTEASEVRVTYMRAGSVPVDDRTLVLQRLLREMRGHGTTLHSLAELWGMIRSPVVRAERHVEAAAREIERALAKV